MKFLVHPTALRQDTPDSNVRGIKLHYELAGGVRLYEDGRRGEQFLQVAKASSASRVQLKGTEEEVILVNGAAIWL